MDDQATLDVGPAEPSVLQAKHYKASGNRRFKLNKIRLAFDARPSTTIGQRSCIGGSWGLGSEWRRLVRNNAKLSAKLIFRSTRVLFCYPCQRRTLSVPLSLTVDENSPRSTSPSPFSVRVSMFGRHPANNRRSKPGSNTRVLCHRGRDEAKMLLRAMLFEACAGQRPRIAQHGLKFPLERAQNCLETQFSG